MKFPFNVLLGVGILTAIVMVYMAIDAWLWSDIAFTAKYLAFLASPSGVAINATLFVVMTVFMFRQVYNIYTRPRHLRRQMTNADWVAWVILPAWKGVAILLAFGISYYGTPAGV